METQDLVLSEDLLKQFREGKVNDLTIDSNDTDKVFPLFGALTKNVRNVKEFQGNCSITIWLNESQKYFDVKKEIEGYSITREITFTGFYRGSGKDSKYVSLQEALGKDSLSLLFEITVNARENADKSETYYNIQMSASINMTGTNYGKTIIKRIS